ncbi:replication factor-a protein [Gonapodya prolifera JEL478]|uniref:Replication protein A subunit n=1 Tax=Gonapodya prolifera (strain JEL478) TaxID=1344416 RepID=A0A138ZXL7_GONPJ|nr:replication factor-a protein [Gonapodya prolifera JEL478]|eukprot:KXS09224.1 replication factor-a protein [Gonapodya prolifera JEL478]
MQQLTPNAVQSIWYEEQPGQHGTYVLQAVNIKLVAGQTARYRIMMSDGTHFIQGMLATQLNDILTSGVLQRNGLFRLTEYVLNTVSTRRVVVILNIEVLTPNNGQVERFGNPRNIEEVANSNDGHGNELQHGRAQRPPPTYQGGLNGQGSSSINGDYQQLQQQRNTGSNYGGQYAGGNSYQSQPTTAGTYGGGSGGGGRGSGGGGSNGGGGIPDGLGPIFPISHLSPYQNKWTIRARAVNKSDIKSWSNQRGEGTLFSVTFVDESGEIRATGFSEAVKTFYEVIQEGQVYYVSRAMIRQAKKQWGVQNEYEMTLDPSSVVERCDDSAAANVPGTKFNFVPLDRLMEFEKDQTIDVVGVVHSYSEATTIIGKQSQKPIEKRELTLVDDSNRQVRLTLWGRQATEFRAEDNPVLAVKGARLGDYGGRSLSASAGCSLVFNPDVPEATNLRAWYDHLQPKPDFNGYNNAGPGATAGGATARKDNFKMISQIKDESLGQSDTPDFFNVRATIIFIRNENIGYPACPTPNCNKKVTEEAPGQWRCEKCNKTYPEPHYRYILSVSVSDHTGQAWLTAFNEIGVQLLGMEAGDVLRLKDNGSPGEFDAVFSDGTFKMFDFRIKARSESYNDEVKTRLQIMSMTPVNWKSASQQLLGTIESYEKSG